MNPKLDQIINDTVNDIYKFAQCLMDEAQQGNLSNIEYQLGRDLNTVIEIYLKSRKEK